MRVVVEEVSLDDVAAVAERTDEVTEAVVGVDLHDVPEHRPVADLDHRLGPVLGLFAHARAQPAAQQHDAGGAPLTVEGHVSLVIGWDGRRLSGPQVPVEGAEYAGMGTTPVPLLVTGASGFVGARVVRMAIDRGHPVTALVGPQSSVDRLLPLLRDIELVRADIADAAAVQHAVSTARPVVCVHLAAVGAVVLDDDLEGLLSTNAVAPVLLARRLRGPAAAAS